MMIVKSKAVKLGDDFSLVVHELTLKDAQETYDEKRQGDWLINQMLEVHNLDLSILSRICKVEISLLEEKLLPLTPSAYQPLIEAAKEVNSDFFVMRGQQREFVEAKRQLEIMKTLLLKESSTKTPSGTLPASSSSPVINTPGATA